MEKEKYKYLKLENLSELRRIECLHEMDAMLIELGVASRYTIWYDNGFSLQKTEEETIENWKRIANDDELFIKALVCYMVCTLEPYTIGKLSMRPIV